MNRNYQRAVLAAIKNQPEYWKRHYASNVTGDGGTLRDSPLLGAELIPDASRWFSIDNDPYWTLNGVTISSGVANCNYSGALTSILYRLAVFAQSKTYTVSYTLTVSSGSVQAFIGPNGDNFRTTSGAYTFTSTLSVTNDLRFAFKTSAFVGTIDNISVREVLQPSMTKAYYKMARENNIAKSIQFAWLGEGGIKQSGGRISKAYSLALGNTNHATQTTPSSQPYLSGNIAPNERYALKNPNGGSNFMTHPTISFASGDSWSVTTVLNWNGRTTSLNERGCLFGRDGVANSTITINNGTDFKVQIWNESLGSAVFTTSNTFKFLGKTNIITLVADGLGNLSLYVNGLFVQTIAIATNFIFNSIYKTFWGVAAGQIKAHIIRSQALTQQQITAEYNLLRSYIPEIESVQIGTQTWATSNCEMAATPMGNVITEMQANGNVELLTAQVDREFTTVTTSWNKSVGATITDGVCHFNNVAAYSGGIHKDILTTGKWFRVTYTVKNWVSGSVCLYDSNINSTTPTTGNGTFTKFLQATDVRAKFTSFDATNQFDLDDVSIQSLGWSGSQELYDGIYAQTAGDATAKTYAAVKAAGFWCHYNNSVDNGAIYGKLLNGYAIKLLDLDIAAYNLANPTNLWGWKVNNNNDYIQLEEYLAPNDAVKIKHTGTTYWASPNNADNSSGFTLLPAGYRDVDGVFRGINTDAVMVTIEDFIDNPKIGGSLRLIKV